MNENLNYNINTHLTNYMDEFVFFSVSRKRFKRHRFK